MKNINNAIWRLIKSFIKIRKGVSFAHDIQVLKSDYSLDLEDQNFKEEMRKQLKILEEQKSLIQSDTDILIENIDNSIRSLKNVLSLML